MNYIVEAPLPCEQRVLLCAPPPASLPDRTAIAADFTDKHGRVLAPRLADMAQRGGGIFLLNLAADPLSAWLARERETLLAQGTAVLCRAASCKQVVVCVVQEKSVQPGAKACDETIAKESAQPLCEQEIQELCAALTALGMTAEVRTVPASPVLREDTALYTVLDTGAVRVHPLCPAFLSEGWQHRPCCTVDGETACAAAAAAQGAPRTKLIAVHTAEAESAILREILLGTKLSEVCPEADGEIPLLLGAQPATFVTLQTLAQEAAAFSYRHDAIRLHTSADCMADCAAKALQAAAAQSCHNCVLCREGSWHLESIFNAVTQGKGKREELALVEDIAPIMAQGALCGFGRALAQTALTAVQTEAVRVQLDAHITKKACTAGVCDAFSAYVVLPEQCTGCGECLDACGEDAIEGKAGFIHMIDPDLCEKCGKCAKVCEENAIVRTAQKIRVPKKLTRVGRFS